MMPRIWMLPWVAASAAFITLPARAFDWTVSPSVEAEETYTSNADLVRPDQNPESSFIHALTPGIDIRGKAGRVDAAASYRVRAEKMTGDVNHETHVDQQYNAATQTELMQDHLFFDARAARSKTLEDSTGRVLVGDRATSGDANAVSSFQLGPRWQQRLGDLATLAASYDYSELNNELVTATDSYSHTGGVHVLSTPSYSSWAWSLNADSSRQYFDDDSHVVLSSASAGAQYRLSRSWSAIGQAGYEDNDFTRDTDANPDGATWAYGAAWRPTSRTSAQLTRSHRFFGDSWNFNAAHRISRSIWSVSYAETLTTDNNEKSNELNAISDKAITSPTTPTTIAPSAPTASTAVPFQRRFTGVNEVILQKRWALSAELVGLRNTITAGFSLDRSVGQQTGIEMRIAGVSAEWSHRLGAHTQLIADIFANQRDVFTSDFHDQAVSGGIGIDKVLGKNLSGRLQLRRTEFDESGGFNDYRENQVTASLQAQF